EELEPPLQAQSRQDEDRRHLRTRRGGHESLVARSREGPLDRREADVREGEEDPRQRAHVREADGRGPGCRLAGRRPGRHGREREEARGQAEGRRSGLAPKALSTWAVLVAAGRGERLGGGGPQTFSAPPRR